MPGVKDGGVYAQLTERGPSPSHLRAAGWSGNQRPRRLCSWVSSGQGRCFRDDSYIFCHALSLLLMRLLTPPMAF